LALAGDLGYHHILCTVSPKNPKSLANMLSCGFLIEALCPKFQGWFRFILHKDLMKAHLSPARDADGRAEQIAISISDLEGQQILLESGFKGFKIETQSGIIKVLYERARSMGENDPIPDLMQIKMAFREGPWPIGPPDLLP